MPQPGIAPGRPEDRFPARAVTADQQVRLWWVGAHGGAGEDTLAQLIGGTAPAGHAWPVSPLGDQGPDPIAALVARTNARGLRAAQALAAEWATGEIPVDLIGLVLVADAPGKSPRALRELADLVAGGVPTRWDLPWVEGWRTGDEVSLRTAPRAVSRLAQDVMNQIDNHDKEG